jgi:hypothetical protein
MPYYAGRRSLAGLCVLQRTMPKLGRYLKDPCHRCMIDR